MIKRKLCPVISAMLLVIFIIQPISAAALTSKGACAIDAYSERVLFEYNADTAFAPASMTKVMTAYIIYDKMRQGMFDKNTEIVCSENAAKLSRDSVATNVPLVAGEKYTVDELIGAIMIPSACAACTLVGEYISGSEQEFAKLMNSYVYWLGLEAYYDDASGLSDNNRITARSMAKLGARMIKEFPDILNYTSRPYITFRGKKYENTNALLAGEKYEYSGADGLKTGTTTLAGRCLTATAVRDGRRIVGVTMGSTSASARYTDIHEILNAGFGADEGAAATVSADSTRLFIDGNEIPSFCYTGEKSEAVIFAEQLENYGFNIYYNGQERTLYIIRDKQKEIITIDVAQFKDYTADVLAGSNLRVILDDDGYIYEFKAVYDLSGYAAISVNELSKMYRYIWDENTMTGHFNIKA